MNQLASGSTSAFEKIYNLYFNSVFYFAKGFVKDPQEAQDITTETFFKCWEKREDFENIYKLQGFLYTTTRNACINAWRLGKIQAGLQSQLKQLLDRDDEDSKEEQLLTARIYQYIYEEIEKLPAQEKNVFKMAYLEGMTNEQIASKLNINNQSVRNYKARALKTMRIALSDKNIYHLILIWLASKYMQ
jgi:RNA polymerase sigma-70 factor (family 1)